jgi:hypothetical protein
VSAALQAHQIARQSSTGCLAHAGQGRFRSLTAQLLHPSSWHSYPFIIPYLGSLFAGLLGCWAKEATLTPQ